MGWSSSDLIWFCVITSKDKTNDPKVCHFEFSFRTFIWNMNTTNLQHDLEWPTRLPNAHLQMSANDSFLVNGIGALGRTHTERGLTYYELEVALCGHMCVLQPISDMFLLYECAGHFLFFFLGTWIFPCRKSLIEDASKSETIDTFFSPFCTGGVSDNAISDGIQRYAMTSNLFFWWGVIAWTPASYLPPSVFTISSHVFHGSSYVYTYVQY